MKLSVIILNYNVRYFLELCLNSVVKAVDTLDAEIIVVDNASSDDSVAMVKQHFSKVILIENKKNVGFAKANNQASKIANGEFLCILNPDTVVPEDFFANVLEFAEKQDRLGILGCRLIDGSGRFLPESKRNIPTTKVAFRKLFGQPSSYYAQHISEKETAEVEILVGAMMLIKTNVFDEVEGFDEDYFMYGEDVDLSYKVLKAGYNNMYLGTETIIHFKGESTQKNSEYLKRFYGSMQIFYKKHFRKNRLYDALVWLGIRIIPVFKGKQNHAEELKILRSVIFTSKKKDDIKIKNNSEVILKKQINISQDNTRYIFDVDSHSFVSIIKAIDNSNRPTNQFRFYLPDSQYFVGSDSSDGRGEVFNL